MASLVLLVSELLRHENLDKFISAPPPLTAAAGSAPPRPATKTARNLPAKCKTHAQDQFQEELPRICVDLVWF